MRILGVEWAPLNVPLKRRLETAVVTLSVSTFVFGAVLSVYILLHVLIAGETWARCLLLMYLAFVYLDNKYFLCINRPEWWYKFIGQRFFWDCYTNYFPIKIVTTAELDPARNYILCTMPHAVLPLASSVAFVNDSLDSKGLFPGLEFRPLSLAMNFHVPFLREFLLNLGVCSCSKESMEHLLSSKPRHESYKGRALMLLVGGGDEARKSRPGAYNLELKRKKGFVKMALQFGTALVPVISFGETDLYDQLVFPKGSLVERFQCLVKEYTGYTLMWLNGRGYFQYSFGFIPKRTPINIVVGAPMHLPKIDNPTVQDIDQYHAMFINMVIDLFEAHKHKYVANHQNVFLNFD